MLYLLKIVLAILVPPLGVLAQTGFGIHFWINIFLTLIGWIPGSVHAVFVIVANNNPQLESQQLREEEIEDRHEPNIKQTPEEIAKKWLKNLNSKSDDYIWFEEFSNGYKSKLEAAIDYLEAMRETSLS